MFGCLWKPEEGVRLLELELFAIVSQQARVLGTEFSGSLAEQKVLTTAELSSLAVRQLPLSFSGRFLS